MGTNYYAELPKHEGACVHCSLTPQVHICKSLTSFQGYDANGLLGEIRSWADWQRVLRETSNIKVMDEYDVEHRVEDFITWVDATVFEARSRQYRWHIEHPMVFTEEGVHFWKDLDGFSFSIYKFS